jgi:hypothetical protein
MIIHLEHVQKLKQKGVPHIDKINLNFQKLLKIFTIMFSKYFYNVKITNLWLNLVSFYNIINIT